MSAKIVQSPGHLPVVGRGDPARVLSLKVSTNVSASVRELLRKRILRESLSGEGVKGVEPGLLPWFSQSLTPRCDLVGPPRYGEKIRVHPA